MHVVVGTLAKDRAWILQEWCDAIYEQDVDVDVLCIYSQSEDNTKEILEENLVKVIEDSRPGRTVREIDAHVWGDTETYRYMSDMRNRLLWLAHGLDADYFFSVDTDVIIPPHSLKGMIEFLKEHHGVVSPAVNMGQTATAWNTMEWVNREMPNMAHRPQLEPPSGQVDVVMAAMLLDRYSIETLRWEAHPQGEDVGFSLNATSSRIPLWWLSELRCSHRMRRTG